MTPLFQPISIGALELKNRVVMAPMTRNMAPSGIPTQANADYYQRRAQGGVGLILSEGTVIGRPASRNEPNIPFFYGESALKGWKNVVDSIHAAGGRMGPQIWHVGLVPGQGGWVPEAEVEGPSGLFAPGQPRGRVMSEADVADTIGAFAQAAADAKRLGFDVVEIHGAHGYLIDEFFWESTNVRDDKWGGKNLLERSRFAVEVIQATRKAVGPDFPLFIRLSQWKQQDYHARLAETPADLEAWLKVLVDAGVDVFHCSQRRFWEPEFPEVDGDNGLNFAGWAKKLTGKTTISVGSVDLNVDFLSSFGGKTTERVSTIDKLMTRLDRNEFDLIAVGRALLSNPQWVEAMKTDTTDQLRSFNISHLAELR